MGEADVGERMTKDFAALLAQVVPVVALAIGLELRALSQRLKQAQANYQRYHGEWADQFKKRYAEVQATLAEAKAAGRWRPADMLAHYKNLRALRALTPSAEFGYFGLVALLVVGLAIGQIYLASVEFYALTVAAEVSYRPLWSLLSVDLFGQLETAIDVAFLVPAVEAAYRAVVFIVPRRGERGRRAKTILILLALQLTLRTGVSFLFG